MKTKKVRKRVKGQGTTVHLGPDLDEALRQMKVERGISKTFIIREAVRCYLESGLGDGSSL